MSTGDRGLVARASRGDVEAFRKLVQEHSGLVYRMALRMLGREHVQDASQEIWVQVWRNMKSFREESTFSTWLHRITVNTCLSFRQRESRREKRELGGETPCPSDPTGEDTNPEAAVLSAERREEIQMALQNVREQHRSALVLRHMEDLSYAEIAEVLDVPEGTAKGWAFRGRAAMLIVLSQGRAPASVKQGDAHEGASQEDL